MTAILPNSAHSVFPQESLGFLLHDCARLLRKKFEQNARRLGLTRAQWQVLAAVCRHEGARQAELADHLDIEPITLARILDKLAALDLVERRADPKDRRAWRLHLTDKAAPLLEAVRPIAAATREEALRGVDQAQRDMLIEILSAVRANLTASDTVLAQEEDKLRHG